MRRRARSHAHKKQRRYYSGKKRRHTQKAQLVVDQASRQILCAAVGEGRAHDFPLFKRSQVRLASTVECLGDRGYLGLQKRHAKSQTPKQKPRGRLLSLAEKHGNRQLASQRIVGEHVIGKLKVFKFLAERYLNRRRRFGLREHLSRLSTISISRSPLTFARGLLF